MKERMVKKKKEASIVKSKKREEPAEKHNYPYPERYLERTHDT